MILGLVMYLLVEDTGNIHAQCLDIMGLQKAPILFLRPTVSGLNFLEHPLLLLLATTTLKAKRNLVT
jgi:hypothetical protein